jgi:TonB family protein
MISKKILLRFILASCAFHVTVMAVAGILVSGSSSVPQSTFSIRLVDDPKKEPDAGKTEEDKKELPIETTQREPVRVAEETADLANPTGQYRTYLRDLRRKIESLWVYPADAYSRSETGTTVLRFSIRNDGSLAGTVVVSSSGFGDLDRGAMAVVQTAAPYAPFPEQFNLSTLHVVAKFQYEMD